MQNNNPFPNYELCDGAHCRHRDTCARFISNVDLDNKTVNPYVIFNKRTFPVICPWHLSIPDDAYPPADGHPLC